MKRSEAAELLRDILYEASGHLAEEVNPEWLLNRIEEKLGMLPPLTKATPEDFTNTGFTQEFLDEHVFTANKWDKEDD